MFATEFRRMAGLAGFCGSEVEKVVRLTLISLFGLCYRKGRKTLFAM